MKYIQPFSLCGTNNQADQSLLLVFCPETAKPVGLMILERNAYVLMEREGNADTGKFCQHEFVLRRMPATTQISFEDDLHYVGHWLWEGMHPEACVVLWRTPPLAL